MKNHKKILSLVLAFLLVMSMSVTAFAEGGSSTLTSTNGSMTDSTDLQYTVTHKDSYTELSGVKLTWTVPVVKYEESASTWDTENLKWTTNTKTTSGSDVSFMFTNYGSYAVVANVTFTPAEAGASSVSFTDNNAVLSSIVNADHSLKVEKGTLSDEDFAAARTAYVVNNCSATITGTVSIDDATKFTEDSGKLGTYNVSIKKAHTVTLYIVDQGEQKVTVSDGTKITFNGSKVTINGVEYGDTQSGKWSINNEVQTNPGTIKVTSDLTIGFSRNLTDQ